MRDGEENVFFIKILFFYFFFYTIAKCYEMCLYEMKMSVKSYLYKKKIQLFLF